MECQNNNVWTRNQQPGEEQSMGGDRRKEMRRRRRFIPERTRQMFQVRLIIPTYHSQQNSKQQINKGSRLVSVCYLNVKYVLYDWGRDIKETKCFHQISTRGPEEKQSIEKSMKITKV